MSRRKNSPTSAVLQAQIKELEAARRRAEAAEDQRRGALLRGYLQGPSGDIIRNVLRPIVGPRESYLFGLDGPPHAAEVHAEDGAP